MSNCVFLLYCKEGGIKQQLSCIVLCGYMQVTCLTSVAVVEKFADTVVVLKSNWPNTFERTATADLNSRGIGNTPYLILPFINLPFVNLPFLNLPIVNLLLLTYFC